MGLQLRALRKRIGLTQEELGEKIGQTARVIGSWERGESALPIDDAARIADVFDCSLDELAGREWRPSSSASFSDPRQAELNRCWETLDPERQERMIAVAQDLELAKRGEGASSRQSRGA